ncbi:hypothetical protein [Paracoccus albus]|uniref:hypothetical protein n=1 Tax=Paracoccus albus TaxID=3017784 RepID=UPI0022F04E7D|nr:hypothetical protein [Paracoccus albus]WBU60441.1 hypothetical protein PAF20_00495 [Paracoccus albus]
MRAALSVLPFLLLAAPAPAQVSESRIHSQLAAQGYKNIEFTEIDGQLKLRAVRREFVLESVYDIETGELLSDRVSRLDAGPDVAETATEPAPGPALVDTSSKNPSISVQSTANSPEAEDESVKAAPATQSSEDEQGKARRIKDSQTSSATKAEAAADAPAN